MTLLGDIPEICGAYVLMKKNKNKPSKEIYFLSMAHLNPINAPHNLPY